MHTDSEVNLPQVHILGLWEWICLPYPLLFDGAQHSVSLENLQDLLSLQALKQAQIHGHTQPALSTSPCPIRFPHRIEWLFKPFPACFIHSHRLYRSLSALICCVWRLWRVKSSSSVARWDCEIPPDLCSEIPAEDRAVWVAAGLQ